MESLEALVEQAASLQQQLAASDTPQNRKLTAKAFVAAALQMPGSDAEQAKLIASVVGQPENRELAAAWHRLALQLVEPGTSSPITRLGGFVGEAGVVLARLGCTENSLQAAVTMELAKTRPDTFGAGTADTGAQHDAMRAKLAALFAKIEASWTRADLRIEPVVRNAENDHSRLSFVMTNGRVFVGDGQRVAERLVNWSITQRQRRASKAA